MRHSMIMRVTLLVPLLWLCGMGCSKNTAPPTPLPADQLPAAMQKAFSKAKPEIKALADEAVAAVQAADYSKAFNGFQGLGGLPELTKEQRDVTTRASMTVSGLLQAAQAQGDQKAAETLKNYRINK